MTESDSSGPSSPKKGEECKSSYRKSNKPLMEKRRRARINTCLGQLKTLVLQAMKKDNAQYSKLEKADILELTVKHLTTIQRQHMAAAMSNSPDVIAKYRSGFNECAAEVMQYMSSVPGVGDEMRTRMLGHLANCLQNPKSHPITDIGIHQSRVSGIPSQHPAFAENAFMGNHSAFQSMVKGHGHLKQSSVSVNSQCIAAPVQFIPGTLPAGQVAFVLASPSPVQAVPLYAASANEPKPETFIKQELSSPVACLSSVNSSLPGHSSSSGNLPITPLVPRAQRQAPGRPQTGDLVWRPW